MKSYKKILATLAALFLFTALRAEEKPRYLSNGLLDNLFVQAGAGVNGLIDNGYSTFGSPAVEAAFGKWWTPGLGVRIAYTGIQNKPAETYGWFSGDNPFGFHHAHVDVIWNVIPSIWGYKETRFFTVSPYCHGGAIIFNYDNKNHAEVAFGVGLFNQFRLTSFLSAYIDARVSYARSEGVKQTGSSIIPLTLTAGVEVNFGQHTHTFTKHEREVERVMVEVLKDCDHEARMKYLEDENARLAKMKELTPEQKEVIKEVYLEQGMVTYFVIDKWNLLQKEKYHLEDFLMYVPQNATLHIVGHADKETGSHNRNTKLALERSRVVKEALVELGFTGEIIVEAMSDTANPFAGRAPKNRCVTITIETK